MPTEIKIICKPNEHLAGEIRTLFCRQRQDSSNPLTDTNFNELLQQISQAAFDEGLKFKYPANK